jgi:hypothetical protein
MKDERRRCAWPDGVRAPCPHVFCRLVVDFFVKT